MIRPIRRRLDLLNALHLSSHRHRLFLFPPSVFLLEKETNTFCPYFYMKACVVCILLAMIICILNSVATLSNIKLKVLMFHYLKSPSFSHVSYYCSFCVSVSACPLILRLYFPNISCFTFPIATLPRSLLPLRFWRQNDKVSSPLRYYEIHSKHHGRCITTAT